MRSKKKRGCIAFLAIIGVWLAVSAYFAYLHTFTGKTYYLDEKILIGDRQFIVQEVNARNFPADFPDFPDYWWLDVLTKLPGSLQRPFYEVVNFYSRPRITYKDTWEVDVKGVVIPRIPEQSQGSLGIYIDGHYSGRAVQQPNNEDYTFFNTRGKYYSAAEVDQPITLIFEDEGTGHKVEIKLQPQWKNKYYFMEIPREMATDPAATAHRFFDLVARDQKSEALNLITAEKRKDFTWPPGIGQLKQMSLEDNLSYSLERQENQGKYPVIYSLTLGGTAETAPLRVDLIKDQDNYEIIDIR